MSLQYILGLIIDNCKNPLKKQRAIDHLTYRMNKLDINDKLKTEIWQLIKELEKI